MSETVKFRVPAPKGERVVLKKRGSRVLGSGLIVPESNERINEAYIVAMGQEAAAKGFNLGDNVVYSLWATTPINLDGVSYLLINVSEIQTAVEEMEMPIDEAKEKLSFLKDIDPESYHRLLPNG